MTGTRPVLAVTPGEPAGIGPDILLRFHNEHPEFRLLAVADPLMLEQAAAALGVAVNIREWQPGSEVRAGEMSCRSVNLAVPAQPGRLEPANAAYVLETLRCAVGLVVDNHADAIVTGPVHKGVINDGGFPFSGHTEFLAGLGETPQVVMMLAAPGLRVALVTTHLPLHEVPAAITPEKVEAVIRITDTELKNRFGIERPRMQVLGLNPHAGEGGHLGHEDSELIAPIVRKLCSEGLALEGPVPADTAFHPPRLEQFDAVIAMYHDQGLPVLKHLGFGRSVNVTLGLPFIRTSVDHGTALDLAWQGLADTGSLYHAALAAEEMARQRRD